MWNRKERGMGEGKMDRGGTMGSNKTLNTFWKSHVETLPLCQLPKICTYTYFKIYMEFEMDLL